MSLRDKFEAVRAESKPGLEIWVNDLDEEDRVAWFALVADPNVATARIRQIVVEEGGSVGKDALLTYRRANGFPR